MKLLSITPTSTGSPGIVWQLAGAGLLAIFSMEQPTAAKTPIIEFGSSPWKFHDGAHAPAEHWTSVEFDDQEWKSGRAPVGYGDRHVRTQISYGGEREKKRLCAFFRREVEIEDPNTVKKYLIQFICDDGAVVYVNGQEVHRFNMPPGELEISTRAKLPLDGDLETQRKSIVVAADLWKPGKNIIAVRVHQYSPRSSDLVLDLSLGRLESDPEIAEAEKTQADEKVSVQKDLEALYERLRAAANQK